jgi:calcineurin-like phosphoesterase family protein
MANIWLISDTHFGHKNIIDYCNRPFKTTTEMDWHMVERWNSVVKQNDHVYHLGDVYMNSSKDYIENIFRNLNGKKRLILGNHDNGQDQILHRYFEKIMMWRCFEKVVLTHVPIREDNFPGKDRLNIHGHIHEKPSPKGPYRCVCVEQINYTPINLEEFI